MLVAAVAAAQQQNLSSILEEDKADLQPVVVSQLTRNKLVGLSWSTPRRAQAVKPFFYSSDK
jgi:hypothetical protein